MAKTLFYAAYIIIAIGAFFLITYDLVRNIIRLKNSSVNSFEGEPVEVEATVDEQSMTYIKMRRGGVPDSMAQKINSVSLRYMADGITFTKEAELVDVLGQLKQGDTVKLVYDSLNSGRAVLADGSETLSAKNGIKWAIGYYVILLIAAVFTFFMLDSMFNP